MPERIVQQPPTVGTQAHFSQLPTADVERSTFDRSAGYKSSLQAGKLVPFFVDEILPGDSFKMNATLFMRMATPIHPLMDNISADIHYFFVPNRLVWDNWEKFMGERVNPDDDPSTLTLPHAPVDLNTIRGKVADYFGLPVTDAPTTVQVNALPFRCYDLIYNEWYRDQNFEDSIPVNTTDTGTAEAVRIVLNRNKRKDYLTSALPWAQKGDPVFLPLGVSAPVNADRNTPTRWTNSGDGIALDSLRQLSGAGNNAEFEQDAGDGSAAYMGVTGLTTDLTEATAATINDLRTSFQIQRMLERDARGGTRYIELVLSHFGVQSADSRMQRPEFLSGSTGQISINPVAQTAPTESTGTETPQGNLAATATGIIKGGFNHSFTEHGYVIGIVSIRADLTYQNGLDRMWSRKTRYDFFWPTLAHLGEQQILNKEVFVTGQPSDDETWGFQERFGEYRYRPGRITGDMRSNVNASLDSWHLAQDFDTLPPLNANFMYEAPPIERVIAVPSESQFILDGWLDLKCTRPMPVYSVPGLIDHF